MKRSTSIAAIAVVAAIALALVVALWLGLWVRYFWFTEVFTTRKTNEPNRAALLRVHNGIDIDDSYSEVLTTFWQERREDSLGLNVGNPEVWRIDTPLEFGASNWTLDIEFDDGHVSAVRVRTADGPPPRDGPKDKTAESKM
jgi:hypothetical protein